MIFRLALLITTSLFVGCTGTEARVQAANQGASQAELRERAESARFVAMKNLEEIQATYDTMCKEFGDDESERHQCQMASLDTFNAFYHRLRYASIYDLRQTLRVIDRCMAIDPPIAKPTPRDYLIAMKTCNDRSAF